MAARRIDKPTGRADVWVELVTRAVRWGRVYFAFQTIAGFSWWTTVFVSRGVREATVGNLDAVAVAVFDVALFIMASWRHSVGVDPGLFEAYE